MPSQFLSFWVCLLRNQNLQVKKTVRKTDRNLVVPIFFALRLPHLKIGFSNFPDFSRVAAATSRLIFSIFFLSCGSRNSRKMRVARVLRQCRNWVLCASCDCRNSENNGKFSRGLVVRDLVARGFVKNLPGLGRSRDVVVTLWRAAAAGKIPLPPRAQRVSLAHYCVCK